MRRSSERKVRVETEAMANFRGPERRCGRVGIDPRFRCRKTVAIACYLQDG